MRGLAFIGIALGTLAAACGGSSPVYTLYRTENAVGDSARVHVATFDARGEGDSYNREGCERARELFQIQPSNRARYWCEAGRFRGK